MRARRRSPIQSPLMNWSPTRTASPDVTFCVESGPLSSMDSAVATTKLQEGVEAVYRADGERLWRAVFAFSGDSEIASDAVAEAFAQVLHRGSAIRDPATWRSAFRIAAGALKSRPREAIAGASLVSQKLAIAETGAWADKPPLTT